MATGQRMVTDSDILILGAGMTGLCAAHYAAQRFGQERVLVLEAADAPGGTARTDHIDGFTIEWGPNGFLDKEPKTLGWMADLGLGEQLVRVNEAAAHRFIYRAGRLHEVKPPPAFLVSPLLSVRGRARLLCEPFVQGKRDDAPESVWEFAKRRIGREAADILVSPMVSGIFGGDAKQLSLEHCFPRMAEMERTYGGLFKAMRALRKSGASAMGPSGVLTSLREGIGGVAQRVQTRLGGRLRLGVKVNSIQLSGSGGFRVETDTDGQDEAFEARTVVVALPAYAASACCAALEERLASALGKIAYAGIAVVSAAFRREQVGHDLNGFGFLVPRTEGRRLLGCLWDSTLFPNRAPEDCVLLRAMYGGYTDPDAVRLSDASLLDCLRCEVYDLLRISGEPELLRIYRHPLGIPQYLLGHEDCMRAVETAEQLFPGLVFAGNAYRGIGLNDCVLSALRAVDRVERGIRL